MKYDIFISYRHTGGRATAQLIYDRLTRKGYQVFFDIESLDCGEFDYRLLSKIDDCKDVIVILSSNAFEDYSNKENWLYQEIKYAIHQKKNILPIKLSNFAWPDYIPKELYELEKYSYIEDSNSYFDAVIHRIIKNLKSRPIIGGYYITKFQKEKIILRNKLKSLKTYLTLALICLFLIVSGLIYKDYQETTRRLTSENEITIELTPHPSVTITEFYDASDILKTRFEILAQNIDYSYEISQDTIIVTISTDAFYNYNVETILLHCVINPSETFVPDDKIVECPNIVELLEYNSTHKTPSNVFSYSIKYPVIWEYRNEGKDFGSNQKEYNELEGDLLRLDYNSIQSSFTDGEFYDTVKILKNRLDCFGTPYAFGYRTDNPHIISIVMDPEYLNEQVVTLLVSEGIIIEDAYTLLASEWLLTSWNNKILDVKIIENKDKTYSIQIIPDYASFSPEGIPSNLNIRLLALGNSIHENITESNYHEHYAQLDESIFKNTFIDNSFIFDSLTCLNLDTIDEKHVYILKLIQSVILDSGLPCLYRIDSYFIEKGNFDFSLKTTYDQIEELEKIKYENILDDYKDYADYEIEVFDSGKHINLEVILHNENNFAEESNNIIQMLYPILSNKIKTMAYEDVGKLVFFFRPEYDSGTGINCTLVFSKWSNSPNLWGGYSEYSTPDVVNRFEEILNTDPFYQQFSVDPMIQTEDGKTTFR